MPELSVIKFSNALEDAGWLGLAAHSFLALFYLAEGEPGAFSSTDGGFVWTKNLGDESSDQEFDLGIGKLKVSNALFSASLGVKLTGGIPSHIDLLINFFGSGAAPSVYLELDSKIVVKADPILEPVETADDPENRKVIAYENSGDPVRLDMPMASIEFSFRIDKDNPENPVISTVQIYDSLDNLAEAAEGLFEFDMNEVFVFPKLGNLGLYMDKLYLDFSNKAASSFSGLFPEVYDPSWKGLGAHELTLLFPVDESKPEFIAAGVQGFMLGFDGLFSGTFNFDYTNEADDAKIKTVSAEIEIRNNEFVKAEAGLGLNFSSILQQMQDEASSRDASSGTDHEQHIADEANTQVATSNDPFVISGIIEARVDFVWHEVDGEQILGFDVIMEGISEDGTDSGLAFRGVAAKTVFWAAGSAFGIFLLVKGIDEDEGGLVAGGAFLLLLVIADIIADTDSEKVLPRLEELIIKQLGFRYVRITDDTGSTEEYYQGIVGWRTKFALDGVLLSLVEDVTDFLFTDVFSMGDVFGQGVENIKLEGGLDLEFENLIFQNQTLPEAARHIFEQHDFHITAKKMPEFVFEESSSSSSGDSSTPKPVVGAEFISRPKEGGSEKEHGISLSLKGLTSSAFKLNTPAAGLVLIFWPEFKLEIAAELTVLPKFTLVVPGAFYAEGEIDLGKPLPSFGGTQNRVTVDVGVIPTNPTADMEDLIKVENYKYRFGGEVAWGEATLTPTGTDITRTYDFLFIEVHYSGDTPLFVIGPVGVFGLGLIFGRNIRPGVQSGDNGSAMGIANWIIGQRDAGTSEEDIFKNVREWPEVPAADGSTWHPAINFNATEETFSDQFTIGLTVKVGSPSDNGDSFKGQTIVMVGFPEFWFAIGGIISIKKINGKLTVVIVYDRSTFAIKAIFEFKVKDDGEIVVGMVPFELGTVTDPARFWLYLGNYDEEKGGPVDLSFLKGLFNVEAYFMVDTNDFVDFGLLPIESDEFGRPTLPGPAVGFGLMFQFGPKKYGPSAVHIKLFFAAGFNIGLSFNPFILMGEIYAGGYVELKVLFISAKIELLMVLAGLITTAGYQLQGYFEIKLDLPWPIPDFSFSCDFVLQSEDFLPLPPVMEVTSSIVYRLEPRAFEILEIDNVIPIDGIISLSFDKPIYEILNEDDTIDKTQLLLNDEDPDNDRSSETVVTDYLGNKYIISMTHVVEAFKVEKITDTGREMVDEWAASWNLPTIFDSGEPSDDENAHQTLYLNTLFPSELQFAPERLGEFTNWLETRDHVYPCEYPGLVCINREPRPEVEEINDTKKRLEFDTSYGLVETFGYSNIGTGLPLNTGTLQWAAGTGLLELPMTTEFRLPSPTRAILHLRLRIPESWNTVFEEFLQYLRIDFVANPRGEDRNAYFQIQLLPDGERECGFNASLLTEDAGTFSIRLEEIQCVDFQTLDFTVLVETDDPVYKLESLVVIGFTMLLNPAIYSSYSLYSDRLDGMLNSKSFFKLFMRDLCIEDTQNSSLHWRDTEFGGSSGASDEEAVDAFTDNLLLDPDSEYEINYDIRSFISIYHDGVDGTELINEKEEVYQTSDSDSGIAPVRVTTGSDPVQDVSSYLGFYYPGEGMHAPYPDGLAPLITFKYLGLIQKIYTKYYGEDVLVPRLVDFDGNEIEPALSDTFTLSSSGTDEALADLLEHCLAEAADFVKLQAFVWDRSLQTDMHYSLEVVDTHGSGDPLVPFSVSFKTSLFQGLVEHAEYVNRLFDTAGQEPLVDSSSFASALSSLLNDVASGSEQSHDALVEKIYLEFLGRDGGRLSPEPGVDSVTYMVGLNSSSGNQEVWGIAVEIAEPLLGKQGVTINRKPGHDALTAKGIYLTTEDFCIVSDRSGSRIIIFNAGDLISFAPFAADTTMEVSFSADEALRISIANYVTLTFPHKSAADQQDMIDDQMSEALAITEISDALTSSFAILNLIIPETS